VRNDFLPEGRCVLASGRPLRGDGGQITGGVVLLQDITEQKRLQQRLLHSEKMEAIATLAGGIAHDFNNVLYAILGYTDLALDLTEPESPARECLEQVRIGACRARDVVRQILVFHRPAAPEREPVSLQTVVREALHLIRGALPPTIEIRVNLDGNCRRVLGDPTALHQAVMNLCTNAYQAMREAGGVLEVGLREQRLTGPRSALLPGLRAGDHAVLVVRDSGCGMDEATRRRIFEPYFTTRGAGEGTGMGLAMVHGVVESLGGAVQVQSEPGRGTTFEIFLPVLSEAAGDELPAAAAVSLEA